MLILGGSLENLIFNGRFQEKNNKQGGLPKKGAWTVFRFNGGLVKNNRWCFSGWVDTPMHTMRQESWEVMIFEGIFGFYIDRNFLSNQQLLLFFFFWSAYYANRYILEMSRYINIVCMGRFYVLTYIERFFSTVCCFFSYISWLVNYKS